MVTKHEGACCSQARVQRGIAHDWGGGAVQMQRFRDP